MDRLNPVKPKAKWLAWMAALFILNLLLTHLILPAPFVFTPEPIGYIDFMQHYSKAHTFVHMVTQHGRTWGYNPFYMAGCPELSVYDIDNKGGEWFVLLMSLFSIPLAVAFKSFIFLELLIEPFLVLAAFRDFGFNRKHSYWAALGAVAIFNGPVGLFFNLSGMYSFAFAAAFSFLVTSLFYRLLIRNRRKKIIITETIITVILTALAPLFHSTAVVMIGLPVVVMILSNPKHFLRARQWRVLAMAAGAAVLVNLHWIIPFFKRFSFCDFTDPAWTGPMAGLQGLIIWTVGILFSMGGLFGLMVGFRGIQILRWQSRSRLAVLVLAMAGIFICLRWPAWWLARSIQPNRFLLLLLLYWLIPCVALIAWLFSAKKRKFLHTAVYLLIFSLAVPGLFMGWIRLAAPPPSSPLPLLMAHGFYSRQLNAGSLNKPETQELIRWLNTHTSPRQGRIMIQHPQGEGSENPFLVFYTGIITGIRNYVTGQFLGAPRYELPVLHNQLTRINHDTIFDIPVNRLAINQFLQRLKLYNVKWIIAVQGTVTRYLDHYPLFFQSAKTIDTVTVYRVNQQSNYFLKGSGNIRVSLNRIELENLSGGDIIIKYHWSNRFRTHPGVNIQPFFLPEDPIGFIRLIHPPSRVDLYFDGAGP